MIVWPVSKQSRIIKDDISGGEGKDDNMLALHSPIGYAEKRKEEGGDTVTQSTETPAADRCRRRASNDE